MELTLADRGQACLDSGWGKETGQLRSTIPPPLLKLSQDWAESSAVLKAKFISGDGSRIGTIEAVGNLLRPKTSRNAEIALEFSVN